MSLTHPILVLKRRIGGFFDATEIILEIHFGSGGTDSKIFVDELFSAYVCYAKSLNLEVEVIFLSEGHITAKITGDEAGKAFQFETGKHVVQRIPPTETKGRKQTSVIAVVVLSVPPVNELKPIPDSDLRVETLSGQGPGGQHMQKNATVVRVRHLPTGLQATCNSRDQHANRRNALKVLTAKVNDHYHQIQQEEYEETRKSQVKTNRGGDKVRTYNFLKSFAVDHRNGKKTHNMKALMKGNFQLLFE